MPWRVMFGAVGDSEKVQHGVTRRLLWGWERGGIGMGWARERRRRLHKEDGVQAYMLSQTPCGPLVYDATLDDAREDTYEFRYLTFGSKCGCPSQWEYHFSAASREPFAERAERSGQMGSSNQAVISDRQTRRRERRMKVRRWTRGSKLKMGSGIVDRGGDGRLRAKNGRRRNREKTTGGWIQVEDE
ncbi:hypothetical protein EI94DRAFT_1701024 [Lactarius quietus]|nr:hypothetical protein EI94DRAFT_1701024 [Lactarius quietus]